ncbi:hypothetical protein TCON_1529 [Astathelohania contejeani]|uniref:Ubiquitin-like domain-containing protein n=1 Tax=Astathelohania contejeani TaxID=164912 RepID=A0ABQ7HYL4_9MICR|nr:hypothetical protein TCON_1529 [Thelohania contejeani]
MSDTSDDIIIVKDKKDVEDEKNSSDTDDIIIIDQFKPSNLEQETPHFDTKKRLASPTRNIKNNKRKKTDSKLVKKDETKIKNELNSDQRLVKIKNEDVIEEHIMKMNDTLIEIHKKYCGSDRTKKLKYKNMIVSKFSTLKGIGFDDSCDTIQVCIPTIMQRKEIEIKINIGHSKSINHKIRKEAKIEDLSKSVEINFGIKIKFFLFNGVNLNHNKIVGDELEDGDVIDGVIRNEE